MRGKGFEPGQSGNPAGRPFGSRNKATLLIESLLEGELETITRAAVEAAKKAEESKKAEEAKKVEGVKFAKAVAGRYDVVVHAQTNKLAWVIARLHSIKGVASTESLITLEAKFE